MSRKQSAAPFFIAVIVLIVVVVGLAIWLPRRGATPTSEAPDIEESPLPYAASEDRDKVVIYIREIVGDEPRLVPEECTVPTDEDPHEAALNKLLATNRQPGPSQSLIPVGTKLLKLEVRDGIAYADFSSELRDNFQGGSMNEALLLNAIVHTLTQFDDVKKVQILIDGQKTDSIGGHLEISQPIEGDSALIGKGEER